jgi:hypothetical protein
MLINSYNTLSKAGVAVDTSQWLSPGRLSVLVRENLAAPNIFTFWRCGQLVFEFFLL